VVPSVVVGDGVAVVCAPKRAPAYAVRLGGKGELDEVALAWQSEGRQNPVSSDVPTPAFYQGHFFVLSDVRPGLSKVEARTGNVVWTTPLASEFLWRASPTAADGKIWCMNHHGDVVVLDAAEGKILHHAWLGEEDDNTICSTLVIAHGALFARTNSTLFCIGN
jgi:outer membrane protein assembly factor BamB